MIQFYKNQIQYQFDTEKDKLSRFFFLCSFGDILPFQMFTFLFLFLPLAGGLITIVTRIDYLSDVPEYKDRLEPLMQQLEKEGKWKLLERVVGPRFYLDKESIIWTHQVTVKSSQ